MLENGSMISGFEEDASPSGQSGGEPSGPGRPGDEWQLAAVAGGDRSTTASISPAVSGTASSRA